ARATRAGARQSPHAPRARRDRHRPHVAPRHHDREDEGHGRRVRAPEGRWHCRAGLARHHQGGQHGPRDRVPEPGTRSRQPEADGGRPLVHRPGDRGGGGCRRPERDRARDAGGPGAPQDARLAEDQHATGRLDRPLESRDQGLSTPAGRARRAAWSSQLRLWQLVVPATLFLLVYFAIPLGMLFFWSVRARGVPGLTLVNFHTLLTDPFFLQTLWLSVRLSLEVTVITLVLGFPLAYLYTRVGAGWRLTILFITLLPLLTSAVVRSFAWIVILGKQGLVNTVLTSSGLLEAPAKLLFTV